jgi:hypothetical protein
LDEIGKELLARQMYPYDRKGDDRKGPKSVRLALEIRNC